MPVEFLDEAEAGFEFIDQPPKLAPEAEMRELTNLTPESFAQLPEQDQIQRRSRFEELLEQQTVGRRQIISPTRGMSVEEARARKRNALTDEQLKANVEIAPFNLREHLQLARDRPSDRTQYWLERLAFSPAQGGKAMEVLEAARNVEAGVAGPNDFREIADYLVAAERAKEQGIMADVGDVVSKLPAFGVEFGATGGAYSFGKAAAQRAGLKFLEQAVEKQAAKAIGNRLARGAVTGLAQLPSATVGVAAQTAANPTMVFNNLMQDDLGRLMFREGDRGQIETMLKADDESFLKELTKAYVKAGFEIGSERTGAMLVPMKAAIIKRWMGGVAGRTPAKLKQVYNDLGWHGIIPEMFEERVNEFGAPLYGEEYRPPTWRQIATEAMAFSVPGAVGYTAGRLRKGLSAPSTREEEPRVERPETDAGVGIEWVDRPDAPAGPGTRPPDSQRGGVPGAAGAQGAPPATPGTGEVIHSPRTLGESELDYQQRIKQKPPAAEPAKPPAAKPTPVTVDVPGVGQVKVQYPKGSVREGQNAQGQKWQTVMPAHYGEIMGTKGKDKDRIDIYVGPNPEYSTVMVINQVNPETGKFDEHKVLKGFNTYDDFIGAYDGAFSDGSGPARRGKIPSAFFTPDEFQDWLKNGDHTQPAKNPPRKEVTPDAQKEGQKEEGVLTPPPITPPPAAGPVVPTSVPGATRPETPAAVPSGINVSPKGKLRKGPKNQPPAAPEKWRRIGNNRDGNALYEDDNGVRSYVANGVRSTEAVEMRPTRGPDGRVTYVAAVDPSKRGPEFLEVIPAPQSGIPSPEKTEVVPATKLENERLGVNFRAIMSGNQGGFLSVDAFGKTELEARANALAEWNRKWNERLQSRQPAGPKTSPPAATPPVGQQVSYDQLEKYGYYRWEPNPTSKLKTIEGFAYRTDRSDGRQTLQFISKEGKTTWTVWEDEGVITKLAEPDETAGKAAHDIAINRGLEIIRSGEFTKAFEDVLNAFRNFARGWQGADPGDTYGKYKQSGRTSSNSDQAVKDAIAKARREGITPEFRSLFGGIDPAVAGTTHEKVRAYAQTLGLDYNPQFAETKAPEGETKPPQAETKQPEGETEAPKAETKPAADEAAIRALIKSTETTAQKSVKMRQMADAAGIPLKDMQEQVEAVLVKVADEIARAMRGSTREHLFHAIVDLYNNQPLFSARTSTSVADQAYSTPGPLAFAARHMTDADVNTPVYDPTAGNGMLYIGSNHRTGVANEINPKRAENLRKLGIGTVTTNDATQFVPPAKVPVVHANPPFGSINNTNYDGYGIRKLEHLISLKALEAMQDDGRAVLILGANREERDTARGAQWVFENYLYGHYNVIDNFELAGELYQKQGAKWPVRVIVIAGRKAKPERGEFAPKRVDRLNTWDEVWSRAQRNRDEIDRRRSSVDAGGQTGLPTGTAQGGETGTGSGSVSPGPNQPAPPAGAGSQSTGTGGSNPPVTAKPPGGSAQRPPGGNVRGPTTPGGAAPEPGPVRRPNLPVEGGDRPGAEGQTGKPGTGKAGGGKPDTGVVSQPGDVKAGDIGDVSIDDLNALVDSAKAPEAKAPEPAPAPKPEAKPPPKLSDVGKHIVEGAKASMDALDQLFGGGGRVGSGPSFDEETYQKAKPHFAKAWDEYVKAGKTLQEYVKYILGRWGNNIAEYLKRFLADMKAEAKKPKEPPKGTERQIVYEPRAEGEPFGTLSPRNIGESTHEALDKLKERVGPLTEFVADRLNMSTEDVKKGLAADQIDGVALALDQFENGGALIIGDETGIGKGRQAAAIIRYAMLNGMIPVFFTKDNNLFTNMYGDLRDIGATNINPFIMGDSVKASIVDSKGNVLVRAPTKEGQDRIMADILRRGMGAAGYNAIFATYSQIRDLNDRQAFFETLANGDNNLMLILDESHDAAGDRESSMQAAFMQGGDIVKGTGSNQQTINKLGLLNYPGTSPGRGGVTYLSATYAKRPDNMPLYFRTDLRKAAQSFSQIVDAMKKGGVALQQAVSEALAKAGQYIRRERDFTGISYDQKTVGEDRQDELVDLTDSVNESLLDIIAFSHAMRDYLRGSGSSATGGTQNSMDVQDFAATVHNKVSQLLLAAKADEVVNEAVAAHERGERPLIALMSTMESFLDDYVKARNIRTGQPIQARWNELLLTALRRMLRVTTKLGNGDREITEMNPADLPPNLQRMYERTQEKINDLDIPFPVSPIDYIIQKAKQRGVTIGELTGRQSGIDYTNLEEGIGTYRTFPSANKNTVVQQFQDGKINGILLNASGSTGISMHADPAKSKDPRKRHMFIAQPALDINVFVQTLGRIKRTGMLPRSAQYTHLVLPLQSELRPAAVASKKMKSLNANTTAEEAGAVQIKSEDFLNKYGDAVVAEYLDAHPDMQSQLGIFIDRNQNDEVKVPPDVARKFSGRVSLLSNDKQGTAYDEILGNYREVIEQLKATGEYDLDIVVHDDWDGTIMDDQQIVAGTDDRSIFTASVNAQRWEITDNRHVPTGEEMVKEYERKTGGDQELQKRWREFVADAEERMASGLQRAREQLARAQELPEGTDKEKQDKAHEIAAAQRIVQRWEELRHGWDHTKDMLLGVLRRAGRPTTLVNTDTKESYDGMLVDVKFPDLGRGLRLSPSSWHLRYMIDAPGGRLYLRGTQIANGAWQLEPTDRRVADFQGARRGQRYPRWVMTGNPIRAYDTTGGRGKVVRFKSRDGQTITGLLMPTNWEPGKLAIDPRFELINGKAVQHFLENNPGIITIEGKGGLASLQRNRWNEIGISVPAAKKTGGDYYLDETLRRLVISGDFTKSGARMVAQVSPGDVVKLVDRIMEIAGQRMRVVGKGAALIDRIRDSNDAVQTKSAADRAADALERLKSKRKPGDVQAFGILPLVWDTAISIAQGVIRAGGTVAEAIAKAMKHIRENHKGSFDEAGAQTAIEEAAKPVATETGVPVTDEEAPPLPVEEWVPTEVKGKTWWVRGRDRLDASATEASLDLARNALAEAGFAPEERTMFDQGDRQTKSFLFLPQQRDAEEAGQALIPILEKALREQRSAGKADPAALVVSIRENYDMPDSAIRQMSEETRDRLFAIAQEEASYRGRMLRALANFKADLVRVGRNVDVYLQRLYSDAFAGQPIQQLVDDTREALAEMLTQDEIDRLTELAKDPQHRDRIRAAIKKALAAASRKQKNLRTGSRWFRDTERLIESGVLSKPELLKRIAAKHGWKIPTQAELDEMRHLAERAHSLATPTADELAPAGDDPVARARIYADVEGATYEARQKLLKRLAVMWSQFTRPVSWRHPYALRENNAKFINELMTANILFRASFAVKQGKDIVTQWFWRLPWRAIGQALDLRQADIAKGEPTQFWKDTTRALSSIYGDSLKTFPLALNKARAALAGRIEIRNVDRLMGGISALERMWKRAEDAAARKEYATATMWQMLALVGYSYRVAGAFDFLHGTAAEWNERRFRVEQSLRAEGLDAATARTQADWVMDSAKAEYPEALALTRSILEARGLDPSEQQVREDAWNMVERRQYQKINELGLEPDAIREHAELYRNTLGWNEREVRGLGGLIGGGVRGAGALAERAGIPLALGRFANAIAIGINRQLHRTPFYGLANAPMPFLRGGTVSSPWSRTKTDIYERRIEAAAGTALGGVALALAWAGLVKVWLRPPPDPEERQLWEKEGHKSGTVEFDLGNGRVSVWSLNTGPFALLAPYFAAGGALNDLTIKREKEQQKLNDEAAKRGVAPGKLPPPDATDWLAVAGNAAYGSVLGQRTASGLVNTVSDYGVPNVKKFTASQFSPMLPGLPAMQEVSRMAGVTIDPKKGDVWDFMFPMPTSEARKFNMVGDPVGTPDDIQRVTQILTGGDWPVLNTARNKERAPYVALFNSGFRPPSINPSAGHEIGGEYRPLTRKELDTYSRARAENFRRELEGLSTDDPAVVRAAYQRANQEALRSVGVAVTDPRRGPRRATVRATGPAGTVTATGLTGTPSSGTLPAGGAVRRGPRLSRLSRAGRASRLRVGRGRRSRFRIGRQPSLRRGRLGRRVGSRLSRVRRYV